MNPTTHFTVSFVNGRSIAKTEKIEHGGTPPPIYPHLDDPLPFSFVLAEVGKSSFTKMTEERIEEFECVSEPHVRAEKSFTTANGAVNDAEKIMIFREWTAALGLVGLEPHPKDDAFFAQLIRLQGEFVQPASKSGGFGKAA